MALVDQLAFSTNAFTNGKYDTADAIRRIAAAGFRGVELLADRPHLYMLRDDLDAELAGVREAISETGVRIVNINANTASGYFGEREGPPGQTFGPCFTNVPDDFPELGEHPAKWRIAYSQRCVDLAVQVGCRDVAIASGFLTKRGRRDDIWAATRDAYREVCAYAAQHNVRINIEYEPEMLLGGAHAVARMIDEVAAANLGVNHDIGHSYCLGEDVCKTARRFGPRMHTTHIEDLAGPTPELHIDPGHLIPGDGKMPLREIFEDFARMGFAGPLIVELYTYGRPGKDPDYAATESYKRLVELVRDL